MQNIKNKIPSEFPAEQEEKKEVQPNEDSEMIDTEDIKQDGEEKTLFERVQRQRYLIEKLINLRELLGVAET